MVIDPAQLDLIVAAVKAMAQRQATAQADLFVEQLTRIEERLKAIEDRQR